MKQGPRIAAALALFLVPLSGQAALRDRGPVDLAPNLPLERLPDGHGYPKWYRDTNGVPLDLCLTNRISKLANPPIGAPTPGQAIGLQPLMCLLAYGVPPDGDPAVLEDPAGYPGNHGEEAFYMAVAPSDAAGAAGLTGNGVVVGSDLALEAAYTIGPPARGDEAVFSRFRIRVDLNDGTNNPNLVAGGTWRVIHPYGVEVFPNVPLGKNAINHTVDIGFVQRDFDAVVRDGRGPFLTWPDFMTDERLIYRDTAGNVVEHFIGDPNVGSPIVGSPFGTNYYRVEGPPGCAIGPNGEDFIETTFFSVSGKLWTKPIPAQLKVDRATYSRDAVGSLVSIWASADVAFPNPPSPTLLATGAGLGNLSMRHDGAGTFWAFAAFAPDAVLPSTIDVTNSTDGAVVTGPLTDFVTATATYDASTGLLDVRAASSDRSAAPPALAVLGFDPGAMTPDPAVLGAATFSAALGAPATVVPPRIVNVASSAGGSAAAGVDVISTGGVSAGVPPVAVPDAATVTENGPGQTGFVEIPVFANDAVTAPAAFAGLQLLSNPQFGTVAISPADPSGQTYRYTPRPGYFGQDAFQYTVVDSNGLVSNSAIVTLTVSYAPLAPVAQNDSGSTRIGQSVVIRLLANDATSNGTLDPGSVQITAGATPHGTVTVNPLNGDLTYVATSAGTDTFTYTVANTVPGQPAVRSAPATVTVNVVATVDTIAVSRALFRTTPPGRWVVTGTSSQPATTTSVTIYDGTYVPGVGTPPRVIGTAQVTAGAFSLDVQGVAGPTNTAQPRITVVSNGGGFITVSVTIRS